MVVKEICSFNLIPIKIHKKKENPNTCIKPEGEKKTLYCQGRKKRYCRDCFPSFQDILQHYSDRNNMILAKNTCRAMEQSRTVLRVISRNFNKPLYSGKSTMIQWKNMHRRKDEQHLLEQIDEFIKIEDIILSGLKGHIWDKLGEGMDMIKMH